MKLENNIPKFYLATFLANLSFTLPIFNLFFLSYDISFFQFSFIILAFNLASFIFEIPSGIIADKYGRKNALILSRIFFVLGFLTVVAIQNYYAFIIGWFLCGVGYAFFSGADSAFMYDTLKELKQEDSFKKIQGRAFAIKLFSMGIGATVGSVIARHYELVTPFYMMLIVLSLSIMVMTRYVEPKHYKVVGEVTFSGYFKSAVDIIKKDKLILISILLFTFIYTTIISNHYYSQPYMEMIGIDLKYFGLIYFVLLFSSGFSSLYAYKLDKVLGVKLSFFIMVLLILVDYFAKAFFPFIWLYLITSIMNNLVYGYLHPFFTDLVNQRIPSHNRATILSMATFTSGFLIFTLNPFLGILTDMFSLQFFYLILGVVVISTSVVLLPILFVIMKKPILKGLKTGDDNA